MSNSEVTIYRRAQAWNVCFKIGRRTAGIYQVPGSNLITFRDVCDELRLCYEFPGEKSGNNNDDTWASIAFALADSPDLGSEELQNVSFVTGDLLAKPVPTLSPAESNNPQVLTYCIVSHKQCSLPAGTALDDHLKAKCARPLLTPVRRIDPRYLPSNQNPCDPAIGEYLSRRQLKAYSQRKRGRSGRSSHNKQVTDDEDDVELESMLAPADLNIDRQAAKAYQDLFRSGCVDLQLPCAVSGQGRSWWGDIGPAIDACHIVPQLHYHLYPIKDSDVFHVNDMDTTVDEEKAEEQTLDEQAAEVAEQRAAEKRSLKLAEAWFATWSPENSIILRKDLHELFHARLFSIHPETFVIRVFVPYDILTGFNGKKAILSSIVDIEALRHHYEMCCIENMAALATPNDKATSENRTASSKKHTSLRGNTRRTLTPSPKAGRTGDPSKKRKLGRSSQKQPKEDSEQSDLEHGSEQSSLISDAFLSRAEEEYKRRRLDNYQTNVLRLRQYD
ncbi:hypothetical protein FHL15_001273 [Xylaria flabelliformis]|uniref:HNH nuclease domain-containing protein n=1 Tax=Xylaria flabelliformis TaxID=2512241 RepID=A0A553ICX7_9PEZI|nr:hypothetical protein FHL15_001273 [Xylaria flabelliformis]